MRSIGSGGGAASVMMVGLNPGAVGLVRETIGTEAMIVGDTIAFGDALDIVAGDPPTVVIVGLDGSPDAAYSFADSIAKSAPATTLVALAGASDADLILQSMRVGYKEFVVLPGDANRLRQVVKDAAFQADEEEEKGLVVAMVGAKGGVGTTVLASNLATELAGIHRVLLIDFDFAMGDLASQLDLKPRETIGDLLERADRLDERSLNAAISVHRSKIHVLPVPENLAMLPAADGEDLYAVVNAAAKVYQFVVLDCGIYIDEAVAVALQVSDVVALVTTPEVVAVRDAFRKLRLLMALGVEKDRIKLIVNRWHRAAYVTQEDITRNLDIAVASTVADDPRTVEAALNEGKLIREVNKKSDVARDISTMVAVITDEDELEDDPNTDKSTGFFASLFSRG